MQCTSKRSRNVLAALDDLSRQGQAFESFRATNGRTERALHTNRYRLRNDLRRPYLVSLRAFEVGASARNVGTINTSDSFDTCWYEGPSQFFHLSPKNSQR